MRLPLLLLLIASPFALVALAACGSAANTPAAASSSEWPGFEAPAAAPVAAAPPLPRACTLVTAEDASSLLALEAALMADDPENCLYSGSSGVGSLTMLAVQLSQSDDVAMAQTVFNSLAGLHGNLSGTVNAQVGEKSKKSGREIELLGDEAWLSGASYGGGFGRHQVAAQLLTVRKGTRILTLNVTGTSRAEGLGERLETLARRLVAAL